MPFCGQRAFGFFGSYDAFYGSPKQTAGNVDDDGDDDDEGDMPGLVCLGDVAATVAVSTPSDLTAVFIVVIT